ncbi:2-hydroxyacid dehydrogenase [Aquimarina sp. U1-2]|uniref:2-hydroxyacid dehydrogenase n=1 Tax=Aquimarina sp. U1-2 TaxID=2823141 RepID=UPI001AECAA7D|nr:2-hydroxyacid dehydrogenase [Aquimarina sp. U1-2]MBP2831498.1 2-hydroxyacid dehydrogenase [Aquimarina sp. U1-2]
MKILIYSAKDFEIPFLEKANQEKHHVTYSDKRLTLKTAHIAIGFEVVSIFSADDASSLVLERLKDFGVRYITIRATGYDNVNIMKAKILGLRVANASGYAPYAIAEHAIGLLLAIKRKLIASNEMVNAHNFSLSALVGSDLNQKTVGIIGTGKIGKVIVSILHGFGCKILCNDVQEDQNLITTYDAQYVSLHDIYKNSDIIFLCVPLTTQTHYIIDKHAIAQMHPHVILINIARGALVHTQDILTALEAKKIYAYGTDVYEKEEGVFFYNHSNNALKDDVLQKLIDLPNVLLTPHQAFATQEALSNIAETTFHTINCWDRKEHTENELT